MKLFAGFDGGGSKTRVAVADERGRVLGRGETGLANLHHAPEAEVRANLARALALALEPVGGKPADVASVFFGMAGVTCEATAGRFRGMAADIGLGAARFGIDHDIRIALAGGLMGRPGIALIVGTGSACYGRNADESTWQTGGWGYLVADEGSGYDLGRRAMTVAVRMSDGRMVPGPLRDLVFGFLEVRGVQEILVRLYERGIGRNEIASLAPRIVAQAEAGDAVARGILESGAAELGAMVSANHRALPTSETPEVVITGGLGSAPTLYRELIRGAIRGRLTGVRLPEPALEPVLGAVLLALGPGDPGVKAAWGENLRATASMG
jgi:N-acetylglucosamine kinase-like BadF-type ATPase